MTGASVRSRSLAAAAALVLAATLSACGAVVSVGAAPTATPGAVLTPAGAEAIAQRVIASAEKATSLPGASGASARAAAFTGPALAAALADAKIDAQTSAADKAARKLTTAAPAVLAMSRGLSYPRSMVVRTTRATSSLPVLYLLTTPNVRTPYKIAASAVLLPGAEVPGFAPLTTGSPALGTGSGLAVSPSALLTAYAAALAYPTPAASATAPFVAGDSFATGLASSAKATAALAGVDRVTQEHDVPQVVGGLRTAVGGALVFGLMDRHDVLLIRPGGSLTTTPAFKALSGLATVSAEADQSTYELVLLVIPASGKATVVGAQEHLHAASGA